MSIETCPLFLLDQALSGLVRGVSVAPEVLFSGSDLHIDGETVIGDDRLVLEVLA